ncbi:type II toxin-antitoxin system ParD family antitoxin [Methylobacterium sp. E-066]|uniref:ribbon-helix-helix domain-containing protein n=1 Tax=Methylobacterium sp. E-066 TaxID=2836584 RepID=UPI001FBB7BCA|nr:type II toxin-antitoxin system ParD family antitoxin [Methylobacterium sp. E-066]MCJ2142527.1 type II toxin-antitoxin system ParD family antitoxin [Methylobacterium sp. E-066]
MGKTGQTGSEVATGRFRDATEVVAAGLRLLEDRLAVESEYRDALLDSLLAAFDGSRPGVPAKVVFDRLDERHARRVELELSRVVSGGTSWMDQGNSAKSGDPL